MNYYETITLKDGRECVLRNGTAEDAREVLRVFRLTHGQTDYLTSYPDEITFTEEQEGKFLQGMTDSPDGIEIVAFIDGRAVGNAGVARIGRYEKTKHRANFGVSVDKDYWGLGIGRALMRACIGCARKAGYSQVELEAVAENDRAIALYRSFGFVECGRNPLGFRSRSGEWQEIVSMRLEF